MALDAAGTRRGEEISDSDGVVSFEVGWDEGPFDVTVDPAVEGLPLRTDLGLTRETAPEEILIWELDHDVGPSVVVRGAVSPRTEESYLLVAAHVPGGGYYQNDGSDYALAVPGGVPFSLVTCEFTYQAGAGGASFEQPLFSWMQVQHQGSTEDITLDIDLSTPMTPEVEEATMVVPDILMSNPGVSGYAMVYTAVSGYQMPAGFPSWMRPSSSASGFDFELTHLPLDGVEVISMVQAVAGVWGAASSRHGTPADWEDDVELLAPTELMVPEGGLGVDDTFVFEEVPADAQAWLVVEDRNRGNVWEVYGPPGVRELALPEPPSTFDSGCLVGRPLSAIPNLYRGPRPVVGVYDHAWGPGERLIP